MVEIAFVLVHKIPKVWNTIDAWTRYLRYVDDRGISLKWNYNKINLSQYSVSAFDSENLLDL